MGLGSIHHLRPHNKPKLSPQKKKPKLTTTRPNQITNRLVGPGRQRRRHRPSRLCPASLRRLASPPLPLSPVQFSFGSLAVRVIPRLASPPSSAALVWNSLCGGGNRGARMTVIDILTRVDAICQKYDKYDVDKLNGANVAGDDPFARLYASVDADVNQCVEVRSRPLPLLLSLSASANRGTRSESDALFWNRKRRRRSKRRTGLRWWRSTPRSGAPRRSSSRRTCQSCSASP